MKDIYVSHILSTNLTFKLPLELTGTSSTIDKRVEITKTREKARNFRGFFLKKIRVFCQW